MLIDWMTLRLDHASCPDWGGWQRLKNWGDRIMRVCPSTGLVVWDMAAWDTIRSDSHQISISATSTQLRIQGSPARVLGYGDAVFGFGSAGRDPYHCASAMIAFVARLLNFSPLPHPRLWSCSRIDVTCNYCLSSAADVRVALSELRSVEGGRYRVSQQAGDTVYWSHTSTHKSGKAYAKGPHLRYLVNKHSYSGFNYSDSDLLLADSLLRLELTLRRHFFKQSSTPWYSLHWSDLFALFESFFLRMVGDVEVTDMTFYDRLLTVAPTPGQGKAAFCTWSIVQSRGWQWARENIPQSTWYRHLAIFRLAGLGDADISAGRVVSLRRRIVMTPVASWDELRRAA